MPQEKFEPLKASPQIEQDQKTGEVITKREKEDLKKRREDDPNWWRESE